MELTLNDKLSLMQIEDKSQEQVLKENVFMETSYVLSDDEIDSLRHIIDECLNLDTEIIEPEINTRLSVKMSNGKVVVVKAKRFNIARFVEFVFQMINTDFNNKLNVVYSIMATFYINFISLLDSDESMVYSFLCKRYYVDYAVMSIEETYKNVGEYINKEMNLGWPVKNIKDIIDKLENECRVIEFVDGRLKVIDELMFD